MSKVSNEQQERGEHTGQDTLPYQSLWMLNTSQPGYESAKEKYVNKHRGVNLHSGVRNLEKQYLAFHYHIRSGFPLIINLKKVVFLVFSPEPMQKSSQDRELSLHMLADL
jgi:hypothetical protein